jgi:type I restriction enzyme S subunit
MESSFPLAPLSDYATVQIGFSFKSQDFTNAGVPVLKIKNVRLREVDTNEVDFVDKSIADTVPQYYAQNGNLLISMTGSGPQAPNSVVGRIARFTGINDTYLINQRVGRFVIKKPEIIDQRYLFYVLIQPDYQQQLVAASTGSANQANISIKQIVDLSIPIPSISEQRAIAGMLGALDDKIELNRRMNRTLESMARAVFRQWFVEDKKSSNWEEKSLDEIADFLNGLALQKFPANEVEGYLPVIKIAQLRTNNTESADRASTDIPPQYVIEDGDILFSWSGSLTVVAWCGGKGALNQHLFKVTSEKYPKWFYYYWTKHHLADFQEIAAGKATTMGHIQRHHLSDAKALVPSDKELQKMDKVMSPILDKIINNEKESRTLGSLRDSLLPKLMRGEVRVKDVEGEL